jgi:GT2 family glycosyltransferase
VSAVLETTIDRAIAPADSPRRRSARPRAQGKFLFLGDEKLYIRGATYGAFRPDENGNEFKRNVVARDFADLAANGLNAVRIPHTTPPRWLLDVAQQHGLYVMVGLSAEQYVGYLIDERPDAPDIMAEIQARVRVCAGHPALLCYAIGNEIPAALVRWLGPRRVERYLERLCRAIKDVDPDGLVTYVNYPTTEYLRLPFLDLVCFNVYLESQDRLKAYLARLHNVAGDRPLLMSEIGLDSYRNGEDNQAIVLDWQVRTAFAGGCAGAFVFSWTDEWFRAGADVEDWAFGLTDWNRRPKPALAAVRGAFADVPFPAYRSWPRMSVVVCSYNGEKTIRDCLEGVIRLEYPDYEVIIVDDGSTDHTAAIGREYGFRVISTENRGLSSARNTGWQAATGEIIAYLDDDAIPDPHWLTYLAATFGSEQHVAVGGPNLPPPGDGAVAECVANAPGGPCHVLLSDTEAEHIPGCNMAVRRDALEAVGGFDPQFRVAGDDVDIAWRLQDGGMSLGFNSAALVWHHRRDSVRGYWKQQQGYGKAEALLERKWPEKYNTAGHVTWSGRLYGHGVLHDLGLRLGRVYHGVWGSAPFQSIYQPAQSLLGYLPLMPEWYLLIAVVAVLLGMSILWQPLILMLPVLGVAMGASILQAALGARAGRFNVPSRSRFALLGLQGLTMFLHLLQPLARLSGRFDHGLTPWRWRGNRDFGLPRSRAQAFWTERWRAPEARLRRIEAALRSGGARVLSGGEYDQWDIEVRGGLLGAARMLMAVEDHGAGAQYVRVRMWPKLLLRGVTVILLLATLGLGAGLAHAWAAFAILILASGALTLRSFEETKVGTASIVRAFEETSAGEV